MNLSSSPKIAVIHYWFVTWRGGEKVVESILKMFPQADVYTLFYEPTVCGPQLAGHTITTSALDKPWLRKHYQKLFPFYPYAVNSLKLKQEYDLIISSESGPAKGIIKPSHTPHLCYIHTPMRYCWGFMDDYLNVLPAASRPFAKSAFERLRRYDQSTVDNVNLYVANSQNVRNRVKTFYNREAEVVYPPIALDLFDPSNLVDSKASDREYYLSFGALTPYKNIGLLVDTFNRNGKKLVVVGSGSEYHRLKAKAQFNVSFVGQQPWAKVREYIRGAKALLFPGEEDFGMVPLEVMAHGVPVIALRRGGALETVVDAWDNPREASGLLFNEPNHDSLQYSLEHFEFYQNDYDPQWIRNHARKFGEDHFQEAFKQKVRHLMGEGFV